MRPRHPSAGFTLIEVAVAATLIATVLFGMGSVMMNYTAVRNKVSALAVAQNIVQAEIDDVLMHTQVENSLVSDTQGRARPLYIENGTGSVLVSRYWYLNFPVFPEKVTHNSPGQTWGVSETELINRFANSPGNLYTAGGALDRAGTLADTDLVYIARLQLYGSTGPLSNIETYINGATSSANPHGAYVDTDAFPNYLIADTCRNDTGAADADWDDDPNFNNYRSKILVVRVYEKKRIYDADGSRGSFINPGGGAKPEITHGYAVLNGKIRL